jgi:nitrogen PTS system EIIA component
MIRFLLCFLCYLLFDLVLIMDNEMMDLDQLAVYLKRDVREVSKLANRGYLPGHKVSGQWRFAPAEINYWIETQMHAYTEEELSALETQTVQAPLVSSLLSEATMAVPFPAGTRASALKELVKLAEQTWQVYDPDAVLSAIKQREEMGSTALASGVAIPHPRRPLPQALGESVMAFGRTASGIPFGAEHGNLTDIFFLVCCRDQRTHLHVLARLSRMMLRPDFLDELRAAETVSESYQLIVRAEKDLVGE